MLTILIILLIELLVSLAPISKNIRSQFGDNIFILSGVILISLTVGFFAVTRSFEFLFASVLIGIALLILQFKQHHG